MPRRKGKARHRDSHARHVLNFIIGLSQRMWGLLFVIVLLVVVCFRYTFQSLVRFVLCPPTNPLARQIARLGPAEALFHLVRRGGAGYAIVRLPLDCNWTLVTDKIHDFPPDRFRKRGSVPQSVMDVALIRDTGDSVFLQDLHERGLFNKSKADYMSAFTGDSLERYVTTIRRVLRAPGGTLLTKVREMTWRLHFGFGPNEAAIDFTSDFVRAISDYSPTGSWKRQLYILRKPHYATLLLDSCDKAIPDSIVGIWKQKASMTRDVMITEISHNMLAMGVQWFAMARAALQDSDARDNPSRFLMRHAFAPFIASGLPNGERVLVIVKNDNYNGYQVSQKHRACPHNPNHLYETPQGEIVARGSSINTDPHFLAFGKGYRRCAGESLTLLFLKEVVDLGPGLSDPDLDKTSKEGIPWGFGKTR